MGVLDYLEDKFIKSDKQKAREAEYDRKNKIRLANNAKAQAEEWAKHPPYKVKRIGVKHAPRSRIQRAGHKISNFLNKIF